MMMNCFCSMTGRQALLLCGKKELGNTFLGVNINCHTSFSILSKLFPTVNYHLFKVVIKHKVCTLCLAFQYNVCAIEFQYAFVNQTEFKWKKKATNSHQNIKKKNSKHYLCTTSKCYSICKLWICKI